MIYLLIWMSCSLSIDFGLKIAKNRLQNEDHNVKGQLKRNVLSFHCVRKLFSHHFLWRLARTVSQSPPSHDQLCYLINILHSLLLKCSKFFALNKEMTKQNEAIQIGTPIRVIRKYPTIPQTKSTFMFLTRWSMYNRVSQNNFFLNFVSFFEPLVRTSSPSPRKKFQRYRPINDRQRTIWNFGLI